MIWPDLRFATRLLLRTPAFSIAAILTIAVSVGMATAVFSVINALLLRPLPYKDAGRLAIIWSTGETHSRGPVSFDDFADWTRDSKTIESGALYSSYYKPILSGFGDAERLSGLLVSHGYFEVMGVKPAAGRFFTPQEDRDGADNVVVLSYDLWRNRFQADPNIVGRSILLSARPHTIVGVAGQDLLPLPPSLSPKPPQIYRPVGESYGKGSRDGRHLETLVRLYPSVTLGQAQAEIDVRSRQMEREHPDADARLAARVVSLRDDLTRNVKSALLALQGAVLLLLLLACANVASLLLARFTVRRQELTVRAALGASYGRLAHMLLSESLVLGLFGGLGGVFLASWGTLALSVFAAQVLPDAGNISLDYRVLLFALLVSIVASLGFGAAPLFHLKTRNLTPAMKSGGRISGDVSNRSRQVLAAAQIAVAVTLLAATGLIGQSFLRLRHMHPGFDSTNVLTGAVSLPSARYKDPASTIDFFDRTLRMLTAMPGVRGAAIVSVLPLSGDFDRTSFRIEGQPFRAGEKKSPDRYIVSPSYFATLAIPLLKGRLLQERDDQNHPPVCVISETAAREWFPNESPLGKRIRAGSASGEFDKSPFREVIGVAGDVAQYGLGLPATPQIYMPQAQFPARFQSLLIRLDSRPDSFADTLRRTVLSIDREQPVYDVVPLEEIVSNTLATRRTGLWLLITFAATALFLASLGVYSVVSYAVSQRTSEFGIRMVLGAQPASILLSALRDSLPIVGMGLVAGIGGSLALMRVIQTFLFGASAADLPAVVGLGGVLLLIAFIACYVPARRAAAVDPMVAIRYE